MSDAHSLAAEHANRDLNAWYKGAFDSSITGVLGLPYADFGDRWARGLSGGEVERRERDFYRNHLISRYLPQYQAQIQEQTKLQQDEKRAQAQKNKGKHVITQAIQQQEPSGIGFPQIMQMLSQQQNMPQEDIIVKKRPDQMMEVLKNFNPKKFGFDEYYEDEE